MSNNKTFMDKNSTKNAPYWKMTITIEWTCNNLAKVLFNAFYIELVDVEWKV